MNIKQIIAIKRSIEKQEIESPLGTYMNRGYKAANNKTNTIELIIISFLRKFLQKIRVVTITTTSSKAQIINIKMRFLIEQCTTAITSQAKLQTTTSKGKQMVLYLILFAIIKQ